MEEPIFRSNHAAIGIHLLPQGMVASDEHSRNFAQVNKGRLLDFVHPIQCKLERDGNQVNPQSWSINSNLSAIS